MIVVAQRWVEGIDGGEQFGRPVVEALVIVPEQGNLCVIYSAFYDPAQGQDLRTAFKWWQRGVCGLLPWLPSHALDILARWALPPGEITDIKTYVNKLEVILRDVQKDRPVS